MAQNYVEVLVRARDQGAKPEMDELRVKLNDLAGRVAEARAIVDDEAGAAKLDALQAKLLRLDRTTARANINMEQAVRAEGQLHDLEAAFGKVGESADKAADKADKDLEKVGKKAKDTAQNTGGAISPLLIGAFAAAASAGPGLILAATATAVLGAGVLITRGNAALVPSYQQLGKDASDAITQATSPLISDLHTSINILDQGIPQLGGELKAAFAAAAPDAEDITRGLLSAADNAIPGITAGLKAIAPYSHEIAVDLGKLGSGVGGLFSGLASGAGGGMQGFSAIIDTASRLLTTVGQVTGSLANGLGPALHDVDTVAGPLVTVLGDVATALPPGMIRGTADAVAFLFAAFQVGKLAGITQEGQSFLQFLGLAKTESEAAAGATATLGAAQAATAVETEAAGAAQEAVAVKAGLMTTATYAGVTAMEGLGSAASAATGPFGLLAAALLIAQNEITKYTGIQLNPIGAYKQWDQAEHSHITVMGEAAAATKDSAVAITQFAKDLTAGKQSVDQLSSSLSTAASRASDNAQKTAAATLAALGARDGQNQLNLALDGTLIAYQQDSTEAGAYATSLDALFGKYQSYSAAQATFTTDLDNTAKQLTSGKDAMNLNTAAGAANFTALSNLSTANRNVAETLLKQTGNQDQANQSLQHGAIAIDNLAKGAGFTKDQIDALNVALYGTKNIGDLKVSIGANTSPALTQLNGLLQRIDSSSGTVQIYAQGGFAGGRALGGQAHGGIVGAAATGGPHNNLTLVGEQGPELIPLPPGTHVRSHPDTMRDLAGLRGSGGGSSQTEVSFAGNLDSAFATLFMRLIRDGKIQIKQKALVP